MAPDGAIGAARLQSPVFRLNQPGAPSHLRHPERSEVEGPLFSDLRTAVDLSRQISPAGIRLIDRNFLAATPTLQLGLTRHGGGSSVMRLDKYESGDPAL